MKFDGLESAQHYWDALCTTHRRAIVEKLGFLNPIYAHYTFRQFQPHSQQAIADELKTSNVLPRPADH